MDIFDPLSDASLIKSCNAELFDRPSLSFSEIKAFEGAGIYSIHYSGDFSFYKHLDSTLPIYIGKAVPPGARRGTTVDKNKALYKRIKEHEKSIEQVSNLKLHHFKIKYLVVKDNWIPMVESIFIKHYKPMWNSYVDGFGNHNPGQGRINGQKSWWDVMHPGRKWAEKLSGPTDEEKDKFMYDLQHELADRQW